jgi:hypothetical protein
MSTHPTTTPWEPPLADSEQDHLVGALERLRATCRWKAYGLDRDGLDRRLPSSSMTIGPHRPAP